jgi:hypothetical protein
MIPGVFEVGTQAIAMGHILGPLLISGTIMRFI